MRNAYTVEAVNGVPAGTVITFAGPNAPEGYLSSNGSDANIADYPRLHDAIGNTFGGDAGAGRFRLPQTQERYVMGDGGAFSLGQYVGSNSTHTHDEGNLSAQIGLSWDTTNGNQLQSRLGTGSFSATRRVGVGIWYNEAANSFASPTEVLGTTGESSIDNKPLTVVLRYLIKILRVVR